VREVFTLGLVNLLKRVKARPAGSRRYGVETRPAGSRRYRIGAGPAGSRRYGGCIAGFQPALFIQKRSAQLFDDAFSFAADQMIGQLDGQRVVVFVTDFRSADDNFQSGPE